MILVSKKHEEVSHPVIVKSVSDVFEKVLLKIVNVQIVRVLTRSLALPLVQERNSASDEFLMIVSSVPHDQTSLYNQIEPDCDRLKKVLNSVGGNTMDKTSSVQRLGYFSRPITFLVNLIRTGQCLSCLSKVT